MHHSYDICPKCGGRKRKVAGLCRDCRFAVGESKRCTGCNATKPIAAFRIRTRANPKPRSRCRDCEADAARNYWLSYPDRRNDAKRRWEAKNPDKLADQIRRSSLRKLGLGSYVVAIAALEVDACEICGTLENNGWRLATDHCHESGRFRGFLCSSCNLAIGKFKDDPALLRAGALYLETRAAGHPRIYPRGHKARIVRKVRR